MIGNAPPGRTARHRILVVEDHTQHAKLLREVLGAARFDIRTAADEDTALRIFLWFNPKLILVDIEMTGADGLKLIRLLRLELGDAELPLVGITSGNKNNALTAGCTDSLGKPLDTRELTGRVLAYLEGQPYEEVPRERPQACSRLEVVRQEFRDLACTQLQEVAARLPQSKQSLHTLRQLAATAAFLNWKEMANDLQLAVRLALSDANTPGFESQVRLCIQKLGAGGPAVPASTAGSLDDMSDVPKIAGFDQLQTNYVQKVGQDARRIAELLARSDFDGIRRLGHQLKGTGAPYGYSPISDLGARIETLAKQQDAALLRTAASDLDSYLGTVPGGRQ